MAKWRKNENTADASHRPHTISASRDSAQEAVVITLREPLLHRKRAAAGDHGENHSMMPTVDA